MTATIDDLAPEMLLNIFSLYIESEGHLLFSRNVVPVCKAWRKVSLTPSLWKNLHVEDWDYVRSLAERELLYGVQTLRISIRCTPTDLFAVLPRICDLKSLEIVNYTIPANAAMVVAKHCPNLECLRMEYVSNIDFDPLVLEELDPILKTCGPKLKRLRFNYCEIEDSEQLITEIAKKCPSLEVLQWCNQYDRFPIYKLVNGCFRLRRVELSNCELVTNGGDDCFGFRDLTVFKAYRCDFHGLDVCSLLRNSSDLEDLELTWNYDLTFSDISMIPSDKVKFLNIQLSKVKYLTMQNKDQNISLEAVERAVDKWKRTLLHLKILGWESDVTTVLQIFLNDNPFPKLEVLEIGEEYVDRSVLKVFVQKCQNLKKFQDSRMYFMNREEVLRSCRIPYEKMLVG